MDKLVQGLKKSKFRWIVLAAVAHLMNHVARSYRWSLLLRTQQQYPPLSQAFLAEMTGFFANALGFRIGEGVRCANLQRMYGTPIKRSLVTVAIERAIDIVFFLLLFFVTSLFYWGATRDIVQNLQKDSVAFFHKHLQTLAIGGLLFLGFIFILYRQPSINKAFFYELGQGIKKARQVSSYRFWAMTCFIWLFYFLLEYVSLFALESTASLTRKHGLLPAMSIFLVLNISHLAPTSNGGGVYHALVVFVLSHQFGLAEEEALLYATITHGIQTCNALGFGGMCALFSLSLKKSKKSAIRAPVRSITLPKSF